MKKIIFLTSLLFILSGCFGLRYDTQITHQEIIEFANENRIDLNSVYILDSSYKEYIFSTKDSIIGRKVLQPLQTICFDSNDSVVAFNANCFAHLRYLTFNLQWNHEGIYDEFPPKNNIFNFDANNATDPETIFKFTKKLTATDLIDSGAKYKLFIFCGLMYERQSSYLIEEVNNMLEGVDKSEYQTYYIITDNMYKRYTVVE
jgi:putative VirB-like lipoprotein